MLTSIRCHVNATKLYLHFGHFAGDAVLCSNIYFFFFVFVFVLFLFLFLGVLFLSRLNLICMQHFGCGMN